MQRKNIMIIKPDTYEQRMHRASLILFGSLYLEL